MSFRCELHLAASHHSSRQHFFLKKGGYLKVKTINVMLPPECNVMLSTLWDSSKIQQLFHKSNFEEPSGSVSGPGWSYRDWWVAAVADIYPCPGPIPSPSHPTTNRTLLAINMQGTDCSAFKVFLGLSWWQCSVDWQRFCHDGVPLRSEADAFKLHDTHYQENNYFLSKHTHIFPLLG